MLRHIYVNVVLRDLRFYRIKAPYATLRYITLSCQVRPGPGLCPRPHPRLSASNSRVTSYVLQYIISYHLAYHICLGRGLPVRGLRGRT